MKTTNAALLLLLSTAMTGSANAFVPPSSSSSLTSTTARGASRSLASSSAADRRSDKLLSRLYMSTAVEAGTLTQQTLDELEAIMRNCAAAFFKDANHVLVYSPAQPHSPV